MDVLEQMLRTAPSAAPIASLSQWLERLGECPHAAGIDRAFWAGFEADRLGYAFVGGYHAALRRLVPGVDPRTRLSLAATESGGAHPRAITTSLSPDGDHLVLRGEKTFATLASVADDLLIVASRGASTDGKNQLCLVRLAARAPGVTIEDRAPTPFAPEIPHARIILEGVVVRDDCVLPGDGYSRYLKPFRTIEDTHVLAASLGHVIRTARLSAFDPAVAARAYACAIAVRHLAERGPEDPTVHIALAGLFEELRRLVAEYDSEWNRADADTRDRWRRDLGLFMVAETVRQARTKAAWTALGAPG